MPNPQRHTSPQIGALRLLSTGEYEFWTDDGRILPVQPSDAPRETPIEVFLDGDCIVHWCRDTSHPAAFRDTTRKHAALIAITDDPAQLESLQATVEKSAKQVQAHMRWMAQGRWDVKMVAKAFLVEDKRRYGVSNWWDLQDRFREAFPDFDPNYWHMTNVGAPGGRGGVGYVDGDLALTANPGGWRIMLHEWLHCCGLNHHEGGISWMAPGSSGWSLTASQMEYLHLLEPENVRRGDGLYFLVAPETHPQAMSEHENKIVHLKREGNHYALSIHDGMLVVEKDWRAGGPGPWSGVDLEVRLHPGESWRDVAFLDTQRGVARIAAGTTERRPYPKLVLPDEAYPMEGVTGQYHVPADTHQGLFIFPMDDEHGPRVAAYAFTWGDGQRWLQMLGPIKNNIAHLTIYAPDRMWEMQEVGEAALYFYNDQRAILKYFMEVDRLLTGKGAMQLQRLTTGQHELSGLYDFKGRDQEGLARIVSGDGKSYGCIFDRDLRRNPRWRFFDGSADDLTIYDVRGGMPNTRTDSKLEPWGTGKVREKVFRYRENGRAEDTIVKLERLTS